MKKLIDSPKIEEKKKYSLKTIDPSVHKSEKKVDLRYQGRLRQLSP